MPEAQQPASQLTPQPQVTTAAPKPNNWKKVWLTILFIVGVVVIISGIYWFFILGKTPSIRVVSPNGGEGYCLGDDTTIKWESRGVEVVRVWIVQGANKKDIGQHPAHSGEVKWLAGSSSPGEPLSEIYQIQIESPVAGKQTSDTSDSVFSVSNCTSESAKEATPSAEKDEMADWKTFKSDLYKYSFNYPNDWTITEELKDFTGEDGRKQENVKLFLNGNLMIHLSGNFVGDWCSAPAPIAEEMCKFEDTTLSGFKTSKTTIIANGNEIYSIPSEKLVLFTYKDNQTTKVKSLIDKVITNLKFID